MIKWAQKLIKRENLVCLYYNDLIYFWNELFLVDSIIAHINIQKEQNTLCVFRLCPS